MLKRTPKGVWLDFFGRRRFVLRDALKRWACPSPEEAIESFRRRKQAQLKILRNQMLDVVEAVRQLDHIEQPNWMVGVL